jgi:hypothetical protein
MKNCLERIILNMISVTLGLEYLGINIKYIFIYIKLFDLRDFFHISSVDLFQFFNIFSMKLILT